MNRQSLSKLRSGSSYTASRAVAPADEDRPSSEVIPWSPVADGRPNLGDLGSVQYAGGVPTPENAEDRAVVGMRPRWVPRASRSITFWSFESVLVTPADTHVEVDTSTRITQQFGQRHSAFTKLFPAWLSPDSDPSACNLYSRRPHSAQRRLMGSSAFAPLVMERRVGRFLRHGKAMRNDTSQRRQHGT